MGKLISNGINYTGGGGGSAEIVEMTQAEYDALPDTKYTDGVLRAIKDEYSPADSKLVGLAECYSLSEKQIGCWTDGKPLYQITIDIAPLPNRTTKEIQLNADIERVISMRGYGIDVNDKWNVFLNDVVPTNVTGSIRVFFNTTTKKLYINTGENLTSYTEAYVTIQYTKTTDTAGSGTWTPEGVPAHHYSTTEQVVGTWTDGSTLYEKTFEFNPPFSTRNDLTLNLPSNAWIKEWKVFLSDNVSSPVTIGQGDELKVINANYSRIVVDIASGTLPYVTNGQISVTVRYTKIV